MSTTRQRKVSVATVWLDGCSGCHMSFLDMDERLIELAPSSILSIARWWIRKMFPEHVDLTLVEGSVSSEEDLAKIKKIREHTRMLIAMGDCAVTGNVPSMRNPFGPDQVLQHVLSDEMLPSEHCPSASCHVCCPFIRWLLWMFLPGCPPSAESSISP